ncbi:MAG: LuxR C-terminal-related transcriptional regulator [Bacteroidota bacterium]|nr:LuxR C-terminal-related transcriptional regulator [Bacteroidota bacterium]
MKRLYTIKRNNISFIFVAVILFLAKPIIAQDTRYGIPQTEYFSRSDYNAASQNWNITQSNNDILYFANNDGILEYDGVNWKLYRDMGPYVIRSVKSIGNKIYAGTYGELGNFNYENNHNLTYTSLATTDELKSYADYWTIHEWNNKVVFHSEQAICIFLNDTLIRTIPAISRFTGSYLVNGLLLVTDDAEGLMEVRGDHIYPVSGCGILRDKLITSVMPLSENKIVIGTMTEGLFIWDMQSVSKWEVPANEILRKANIYCGAGYEDRYLVFGTIQSGVVITDASGRIIFQVGKDKGLNNNTVLSLFVDKDGNVWGGLDNGIVKINLWSCITFLQGYYDLGTGYVINRSSNNWYFGTNQALFTIPDEDFSDPLKDRDDFVKVPGTDGQVWSLYKTGNSLLCGHNSGVFEVNGGLANLITPTRVNGTWIFRKVPGEDKRLIAGTYNGLILLERHQGHWQYKSDIKGFNESSRYIEWDRGGNLWISHGYKGIFRLVFNEGYTRVTEVDTFDLENYPEIGPAPVISKVDGELLVTSNNGIFKVNESGGIERYRELDNYFENDFPSRLIQDRFRNIWYFINRYTGVLRFMEDGTYKNIYFPFISLENKLVPSFESVFVHDNDNILFGIEEGFAHYTVTEGMDFNRPFKLHIRSFKGRSDTIAYVMNQDDDNGLNVQERIPEYHYRDNFFEIRYAATYFSEGYAEYSTYLSNYDLEATSWSRNTSRQFARLEEGDYEFLVKARNSFGFQPEPLIFRFRVLPPWYRTTLAKIAYVTLILSLIFLTIYVFNRRIEINRQKEELRQQESFMAREEKLKSEGLEVEKELIRMRNERLRSEMVFKEKELANSTMNILQKNESLLKIKNDMSKISSLDDNSEIRNQIIKLIRKIEKDIDNEDHWKVFEVHLEQVHDAFLKKLEEKHPDLTNRERKLCAYIRMGMSSKEIAALTNISFRSVENNRFRLRKKLKLSKGNNLVQYLYTL